MCNSYRLIAFVDTAEGSRGFRVTSILESTAAILEEWIEKVKDKYSEIYLMQVMWKNQYMNLVHMNGMA